MSALVLRWLNEELQLHHKVEVLERDASNGYIIAEVLHLQGLEPQFETYQNSSTTAAKIHNMELLGEKLETLGVPFPVNTRRAIMMEERSAVLQFLLQLKDFLRRRPKMKLESSKVVSVQPLVKTASVKSNFPPRDVEERFVLETTKKFHPKDVNFHKGIDMAVHLRRFEQRQWETEKEFDGFQQKAKVDNNSTSAAGYAAARAHLQEKAEFMRDWDREHQQKWKQTQRRYLATERDDLRLELALEARRQLAVEEKLAESQHDAADGVNEFEKNMNRLGLATGGASHTLHEIPATDKGALAHLRSLEKRVEDLDFRPSNNVKMMKELRKRRKAQLAAEKDRRMRRQKALADQKKATIETHDTILSNSDQGNDDNHCISLPAPVEGEMVNPREEYLEEKKQELQEHYTRLRKFGNIKREENMKTLEETRLEKRKKQRVKAQGECSEAVDGLISLAIAIVSSSDRDTLDVEPLKKELFLSVASPQPLLSDQGGQELRYELDTFIHNFLSCSEVWATLPLQSKVSTYDVKSDIQALAESWANPTAALDTSWSRPSSFVLISVFTKDESGVELARRVSTEHHLVFLQLEPLVDECVRLSYDPQKIGDQLASLSDRERELGAFGPKISSLRVKNAPLPDSITVEIVAKAVSLCRREASATLLEPNGCILHNFPRSLDEAKLFEKTVLSELPNEECDPNAPEGTAALPEDAVVSTLASAWDCVVSIASDQPPRTEQDTANAPQNPEPSSKMLPAESQRKLALDEEQRAQNEEKRANLGAFWGQTTRHVQIKPLGLHRDVLAEIFHLCVDVYSQTSFKTIPAVLECRVDRLPEELKEERDKRRQTMGLVDRILWMKATNEMKLENDAFTNLLERQNKLEAHLYQKLREPMATIRSVIQAISTLGVTAQQELESEVFSDSAPFQALLDQTATKLKALKSSNQAVRERILTELEVSLGDLAEANRVAGNEFANAFALDPFPAVMSAVEIVYQCLPSICLYLKDYTSRKLELLDTQLYDHVSFLCEDLQSSGRQVILSKLVTQEAMTAATELEGDKAGEEVLNLLSQVAVEFSFHVADDPPVHPYALSQTNVTTEEVSKLLQRVALLCRFADRLRQSVGQLYADDLQVMQQTVQQEIHTKDQSIAQVMADLGAHGRATWSIRDLNLSSMSVASRRPRRQKENFLTLQQFGDLIHAFEHFEPAEDSITGAFGAAEVASDVFVALILEVAGKAEFPSRWRDASAVAALTLQQCSTQAAVSWRKFVWSLLCIQFVGFPSLDDLLAYEQRAVALPANKRQQESVFLSHKDFLQLPLWSKHNRHDTEELKELIFRLFTNQKTAQISLLPMLLHWCVHPSCFSVRHELQDFTPRYPRGLFRAFHVLKQHSRSCISAPSALNLESLTSFLSFQHDCSNDLHRFFLIHDPLEALVQP
ncbi:hypothetical protein V7S43_004865 [Phytophthora oleae]|uniref:Calponin-homology (CH) domain-containing protein n=1 Tax=Phytophthora oleae TaxID=2107226 RepID=A0ABD3FVS7_9STRA